LSESIDHQVELLNQLLLAVKEFVQRDVLPVASKHDHDDSYPSELVDQMAEMGLFGMTVPEEFGGLGVDVLTFSMVFEELAKGWMSLTGPIGSHSMLTRAIVQHGR